MNRKRKTLNKMLNVLSAGVAVMLLALCVAGCGASHSRMTFASQYVPQPGLRVEVGPTVNETGRKFDIDIEGMLTSALTKAIRDKGLLQIGAAGDKLVLSCRIVEYDKGSAFKRWVWPGWGSTALSIECDLREGSLVVATIEVRRTIDIGGAYTIGAWQTVFKTVAEDVAKELAAKMPK